MMSYTAGCSTRHTKKSSSSTQTTVKISCAVSICLSHSFSSWLQRRLVHKSQCTGIDFACAVSTLRVLSFSPGLFTCRNLLHHLCSRVTLSTKPFMALLSKCKFDMFALTSCYGLLGNDGHQKPRYITVS